MAIYNKFQKGNPSELDSHVHYKKQDEFFEQYYIIRKEVVEALALAYRYHTYNNTNTFSNCFEKLKKYLLWVTEEYELYNKKDEDEEQETLNEKFDKLYREWLENKDDWDIENPKYYEFYVKVESYWNQDVAKQSVQFELTPKPKIVNKKLNPIEEEIRETKRTEAYKEALKAMNDILSNTEIREK